MNIYIIFYVIPHTLAFSGMYPSRNSPCILCLWENHQEQTSALHSQTPPWIPLGKWGEDVDAARYQTILNPMEKLEGLKMKSVKQFTYYCIAVRGNWGREEIKLESGENCTRLLEEHQAIH